MDKQTARQLLFFVNDPKNYGDFQTVLAQRIGFLKEQLTVASTHEQMLKYQGAISELKVLQSLKEEVQQKAK